MLQERIESDLREAMRAKDAFRTSVLRMLRSALLEATIAQNRKALTEEQAVEVLRREQKKLRDAAADFTRGGRGDLAERAEQEIGIIAAYLPEEMSEEGIREVVKQKIAELGAAGQKDFGRVVGAVMKDLRGKADGGAVSKVVREMLGE